MKHSGMIKVWEWMLFSALLCLAGPGLAQEGPAALQQADRLYGQADTLFFQQKDSLALVKYQQARTIYLRHNWITPNLVDACLGMGIILQIQEKYPQAIGAYKESIRYQKKVDPRADARHIYPLILIANCYSELNQYDSAYAYYGQVEPLLVRYPENQHALRFYNSMGYLYYYLGNYAQSINYFEKALKLLGFDGQATDQADQAKVIRYVIYHNNIAGALGKLGRYQEAIAKTRGLIRYGFIPNVLYQHIASAYLQMQQADSARAFLKKVNIRAINSNPIPGTSGVNPIRAEIEFQNSMGRLALLEKKSGPALAYFNRARQISLQHFKSQDNRDGLASAYIGKAQAYELQQLYGQALRNYQYALQALHFGFQQADIYRNPTDLSHTASPLLLFKLLSYKARAFGQYHKRSGETKDLQASLRTYQLAFQLADFIRKGYDSDEAKLFFANTVSPEYEAAIATAFALYRQGWQQHYLETAFALAEQSKAAVLAESLRELQIRQVPGISAALLQEERNLKRRKAVLNQHLAEAQEQAANDPAKKEKYRDQLRETEIKLAGTLKELEKNKQYYQLKYDASPVQVGEIQKSLDEHTAFLEYFVGRNSLFVFVITRDGFQARQSALGPAFHRDWQMLYRALYQARPGGRYTGNEAAHRLYRKLIVPVAAALDGKDRLIIVQDKELCYLPFEALVSESTTLRYLLQDYTVGYAYSGRLLRPDSQDGRPRRQPSVLAMAPFVRQHDGATQPVRQAPMPAQLLPPLLASAGEVQHIGGQVLLGADATKQRLLQQAGQHDIVHLATHAKANMEQPLRSFIAFYPAADEQSGYRLYVPEIYNLRFDKLKLVVLSACETGGGRLVKGEGIMSLARAFAYAGCPSTVTTLWKAEDKTTAYISTRLYAYLKAGKPKDVALRLAKLDYLESQTNWRKRSPVYWANFIFIGDQAPVYTSYAWVWWVLGGLAAAGAAWLAYKKGWPLKGKKGWPLKGLP